MIQYNPNTRRAVGQRLKQARMRNKLSLRQAVEQNKLPFSHQTLHNIEKGNIPIDIERLQLLANVYQVSLDELLVL